MSECYECQPKPAVKTYPGCTIRNTPSESIHCIVWAKHLFNQLYGQPDADNDVSPDTQDPEGVESGEGRDTEGAESGEGRGTEGAESGEGHGTEGAESGNVQRISTRQWAENNDYNPQKLFHKV